MLLDRIDLTEIEVEIEKGLAKARYEMMSSEQDEEENEDTTEANNSNADSRGEEECHQQEIQYKTINYANLRATEIPTVPRLYPPRPGTVKKERIMDNIQMKMMETAQEYKNKH